MTGHRTRNAILLGVVVVLGVMAAGWFMLLAPRLAEADDIALQAQEQSASNVQSQNRYNQTLTQAASATQAASEAQALFSTMPEEADLPSVISQINEAATSAGIKESEIALLTTSVPRPLTAPTQPNADANAAAPVDSGVNLAQMDLSMTVNGTHQQLLDFMTNIQSLDRAVLIKSNELTTTVLPTADGGKTTQETLKLQASMFVLQSKLPDLVAHVQDLLTQAQTGNLKTAA
jgi:Tfp pilus assembly protein PilO